MSRRFRDIRHSTIYPFEGAPAPQGVPIGGFQVQKWTSYTRLLVHCNYGSIWLRFRDMTRDRETDRRTDRRTDRHPHRFMIWPHIVGHIIREDEIISWPYSLLGMRRCLSPSNYSCMSLLQTRKCTGVLLGISRQLRWLFWMGADEQRYTPNLLRSTLELLCLTTVCTSQTRREGIY